MSGGQANQEEVSLSDNRLGPQRDQALAAKERWEALTENSNPTSHARSNKAQFWSD